MPNFSMDSLLTNPSTLAEVIFIRGTRLQIQQVLNQTKSCTIVDLQTHAVTFSSCQPLGALSKKIDILMAAHVHQTGGSPL